MGPLSRFLRRRRVEVGIAFAILALVVLGVGFSLPESHVALARVGPNGTGYDEPVGRYLAEANSAVLLSNLAGPQPEGIAALWVGPPQERLRPLGWKGLTQVRDDPTHNLEIEVRAQGLDPEEALRVANGVAAEIVRLDGMAADASATAPIPSQAATSGPSVAEIQAALAKLRSEHPALVSDDGAGARLRSEEQTWERRRESERGLETRYTQEVAHGEDLRQRVLNEARALWEGHKSELRDRARQAALAARTKAPVQFEEPTGALAELEAELRRLLATLTLRHPEVRRLLRRIELERARLASLSASEIPSDAPGALPDEEVLPGALPPEDSLPGDSEPAPAEGTPAPAEGTPAPAEGTAPAEGGPAPKTSPEDGPSGGQPAQPGAEPEAEPRPEETSNEVSLEFDVSDDEQQSEGRALEHEQEVPAEWIQRAPSYREWIGARDRASRTRAQLEAEHAQTEAMRLRLDRERRRLEAREGSLVALRGTEAHLEEELARARQMQPAPVALRSGPRARLQASAARPVSSFRPLDYLLQALLGAALASLLFGWWVDRRDPAIHSSEDLSDLRVPVLGVIPHLR